MFYWFSSSHVYLFTSLYHLLYSLWVEYPYVSPDRICHHLKYLYCLIWTYLSLLEIILVDTVPFASTWNIDKSRMVYLSCVLKWIICREHDYPLYIISKNMMYLLYWFTWYMPIWLTCYMIHLFMPFFIHLIITLKYERGRHVFTRLRCYVDPVHGAETPILTCWAHKTPAHYGITRLYIWLVGTWCTCSTACLRDDSFVGPLKAYLDVLQDLRDWITWKWFHK